MRFDWAPVRSGLSVERGGMVRKGWTPVPAGVTGANPLSGLPPTREKTSRVPRRPRISALSVGVALEQRGDINADGLQVVQEFGKAVKMKG